jgi:hypothetical protein
MSGLSHFVLVWFLLISQTMRTFLKPCLAVFLALAHAGFCPAGAAEAVYQVTQTGIAVV